MIVPTNISPEEVAFPDIDSLQHSQDLAFGFSNYVILCGRQTPKGEQLTLVKVSDDVPLPKPSKK